MNATLKKSLAAASLATLAGVAVAASHSDAPMMVLDPSANITDVYSFVGRNAQGVKVLNLIMNVNPLEDPGNGVIFDKFGEDVRYSLHVVKPRVQNGQPNFARGTTMSYHFRFNTSYKNPNTILSYGLGTEAGPVQTTGDARQNFLQNYTITLEEGNRNTLLSRGRTLLVPPVNVGPRTTPNYYDLGGNRLQGAATAGNLPSYVQETVYSLNNGLRVWAGQREDGFYADTPGIFDFLGFRSPGKDGFSGYNVHSIALQIPVSELTEGDDFPIVGVYGTTSRQAVTLRSERSGNNDTGAWIQVSRMGNPLFNEVLVALADKDRYNRSKPSDDARIFSKYARRNEVAFLANAVLGTNFTVDGRTDLEGIFIPDVIRTDLSTEAVPLAGQSGYNRLSFIGGDVINSPFQQMNIPSGWPNGRRFGDDVVDIALTAIASGPSYSSIIPLGDNVNSNDSVYDLVFPYGATPWGGPGTTLHP